MGGNKHRKSSPSFFSIFNIFSSKKSRSVQYDSYDSDPKVWPSDYDRDQWGVAESDIDRKAEAFILKCSESEHFQLDPAAGIA
ncbi:hypothetical protein TanjilG_31213 [Lupinus angustifolius]|uniref:Uncharacterized protein n=1 Tax=Lupinus angustifolius TaxID=3871 RepID=A0A1J7I0G0_LUPAN|nr:hypothetical protein TanjilG_31213 [Lupinus angustifolius]